MAFSRLAPEGLYAPASETVSNIRTSYHTSSPPSAASPSQTDKQNLSLERYYAELQQHRPELQALEEQRRSPECQSTAKQAFARVRDVLNSKRKSHSQSPTSRFIPP